jgi:hypothetical protein
MASASAYSDRRGSVDIVDNERHRRRDVTGMDISCRDGRAGARESGGHRGFAADTHLYQTVVHRETTDECVSRRLEHGGF